ncbi:hypothetical protein CsSME_00001846 [Camellia sinensis var. sinensis]
MISCAFGVADAHVQGGMVSDLSFMLPDFLRFFILHVFCCWFGCIGGSNLWLEIDYKSSI